MRRGEISVTSDADGKVWLWRMEMNDGRWVVTAVGAEAEPTTRAMTSLTALASALLSLLPELVTMLDWTLNKHDSTGTVVLTLVRSRIADEREN